MNIKEIKELNLEQLILENKWKEVYDILKDKTKLSTEELDVENVVHEILNTADLALDGYVLDERYSDYLIAILDVLNEE